jgi:UbiD family decarboxylase
MSATDLRGWIKEVESVGELKKIVGADKGKEIGGFVDIYQRRTGNPALLFDEIPGFPKGHRVLANILTSTARINVALGLPAEASAFDQVSWWRSYMKNAPTTGVKEVASGPVFQNVVSGDAVDIERIPTPLWHETDGGPFIGTACMVVTHQV